MDKKEVEEKKKKIIYFVKERLKIFSELDSLEEYGRRFQKVKEKIKNKEK